MRKIMMGILHFRERLLPQYEARFRELAESQSPDALLITCSDSRLLPDVLMSIDPGDMFVMRNVGNLVPPATVEGASTGEPVRGDADRVRGPRAEGASTDRGLRPFRVRRDEGGARRASRCPTRRTSPSGCTTPRPRRSAWSTRGRLTRGCRLGTTSSRN